MDKFIPLFPDSTTAPAPGPITPRLRVHPAEGKPEPFQPVTPASPLAPGTHACPASTPPEVTFQRSADRITQIRIKCSCGQIIVLDCEY